MSIQDSGSGALSYSDHDVHHVRHGVRLIPGTGGDNFDYESEQQFEITERGLDPDELAELKAMRVTVGTIVNAAQGQDSRGEISFSLDAGFNTSASEVINGADVSQELADPDGDGTDEVQVRTADTDEVGQLYSLTDNFGIGYDDDTNGNGAGGYNNVTTELLNFSELFGSGPYVDAADDFISSMVFRPDNVIEGVEVRAVYSLYYNVQQTEGGRSRFGR